MSRIINSIEDPKVGVVITTRYQDGSIDEKSYLPGDIVTDFRYRENGQAKLITGRIHKINYNYKNTSRTYSNNSTSYFAKNCTITNIVIDASEHYESNLIVIPIGEVLEPLNVEKTVLSVRNTPFLVLVTNISLSDETTTTTEIRVGTDVQNMEYELDFYSRKYVSGRIIDIVCNYTGGKLYANNIVILNTNNAIVMIDNDNIISLGEEIVTLSPGSSISDAITNVNETNCISLQAGIFEEQLNISGEIYIRGNRAGALANTGARKSSIIASDETVFTKTINLNKDAKVILDGIVFTEDSLININGASEVTIRNCKFVNIKGANPSSGMINSSNNASCKLNVLCCYFGNYQVLENANVIYNLINLSCSLKDNSAIRSNYFEAKCCTHNTISLYNVDQDANINISRNIFEYSGNAIRLGMMGDVKCIFTINSNTYNSTDESNNGEYAGLLLIQPNSGDLTKSMKNLIVYIDKTVRNDNYQLFYLYAPATSMQFTNETKPTIYVDGLKRVI